MNADEHRWNEITEKIIGCAMRVSNNFGCGLLEKPYKNSMVAALRKASLAAEPEQPINLYYEGVLVGKYFADIVVEDTIIIEIKAVKSLEEVFSAQCLNYLKATGLPICLLINFGRSKLEIKRFIRTKQQ